MRRTPLLLAALIVAASCSSTDSAVPVEPTAPPISTASSPTTTAPEAIATTPATASVPSAELAPVECVAAPDASTDCFELTLDADPADAGDGTVTLPVTVLRATEPGPLPPVVIPGGGPGFAAVPQADYWATHAIRSSHDIVLYDQRGTGGAQPSLECPERDREVLRALQSFEEPPLDRYAIAEAWLVCQARLEAEGIDLNDYDTAVNAADLDALRAALGYDTWTILGISYGSRLALESMRSFPDGLASVILDSVYDVDQGGVADTLASGERAIELLSARNPNVAEALDAARDLYNSVPWVGSVDLGDGNGPQDFTITGDDLIGGVFSALYDTATTAVLPGIIQELANGDSTIIPAMLQQAAGTLTGAADGMQLSVDCADNAGLDRAAADEAAREDPGRLTLPAALAGPSCEEWAVAPTRAGFNTPVVSDIPALVLAGEFDPITPPDGTAAVAERLPNARYFFFPGFGHGITGNDVCATAIEIQFLTDPTAPIISTCIPAPTS